MKRYVIYQRVSTEEQKQKGYSLEAMQQKCLHYIKSQEDAQLVRTYEDAGFSGSLPPTKRPAIKKMLDDMTSKQDEFDAVLVWKLDRLSRSLRDTLNLEFILSKYHKSLESVTERLDTGTASGRMFFNTIASFAEFEAAQIKERTFNAMSSKVGQKHLGGVAPIGYQFKDKILIAVESEASIVRKIFKIYITRRSFNATAKEMNRMGLLTRRGYPWSHTRVKEIIINPVYAGKIAWHKTSRGRGRLPKAAWLVSEHMVHEPIVNEKIFRAAQSIVFDSPLSPCIS